MLRNKMTKTALLLIGAVSFAFSGCNSIMSDQGTDSQIGVNAEDYLSLEVLNESGDDAMEALNSRYELYTIEYGTFETQPISPAAEIVIPSTIDVKANFDVEEVIFEEFAVKTDDYVEEGDPIAYVTVKQDEVAIESAEIAVEQAKRDYEAAKKDYEVSLEERDKPYYINETDMFVMKKGWEIADLRWQQSEENYLKKIVKAEKKLKEVREDYGMTAIVAPTSGYIQNTEYVRQGVQLKKKQLLATLAPTDDFYLAVGDSLKNFGYGMDFVFTVQDRSYKSKEWDAQVVSAPGNALYCNLSDNRSYLKVDAHLKEIGRPRGMSVTGVMKHIENVLLVPADAVGIIDEKTYVTRVKEDGSLETVPFIAGGSDSYYYWAISGLEEGMTIIVK